MRKMLITVVVRMYATACDNKYDLSLCNSHAVFINQVQGLLIIILMKYDLLLQILVKYDLLLLRLIKYDLLLIILMKCDLL